MAKNPIVSIVIPTYKRAALVTRAIQSILNQSFQQFEIVVVDDGSPDNTGDVVRCVGDSRVRYVRHEKNKGLPAARNTGIDAARGKYIAFLDDDDEWRQDKLEKQLSLIEKYDAVLCGAKVNKRRISIHKRVDVSLGDLRGVNRFNPSGLLARASVLREVRFDETLRQGEDWDAFIRIAKRYRIGYVREPLILYNDGSHPRMSNETSRLSGAELEKQAAVLYKHRQWFGERLFKYHLAHRLLSFVSGPGMLSRIRYAVQRCGAIAVASALLDKVRWRVCDRVRDYV